jgi:hypothetical protein
MGQTLRFSKKNVKLEEKNDFSNFNLKKKIVGKKGGKYLIK